MNSSYYYTIEFLTNQQESYLINGPKGEQFAFYGKHYFNAKLLDANDCEYITYEKSGTFSKQWKFKFLKPSPISKLTMKPTKKDEFQVKLELSSSSEQHKWIWKREDFESKKFLLVDKANPGKLIAEINNFSLFLGKPGTLTIDQGFQMDLWHTILITALVVFRENNQSNVSALGHAFTNYVPAGALDPNNPKKFTEKDAVKSVLFGL